MLALGRVSEAGFSGDREMLAFLGVGESGTAERLLELEEGGGWTVERREET